MGPTADAFYNILMLIAGLILAASLQSAAPAQAIPALEMLPQIASEDGRPLDFSRFAPEPHPVAPAAPHVVPAGTLGAAATVVPLSRIFESMRATRTVFYAGGVPVHIYGGKSENNLGLTGWFLQLYPEGAPDVLYFNGAAMAHVLVKFWGSSRVEINGAQFSMHMDISIGDPPSSRLEIEPKKPAGAKISFTAGEIARGTYETGYPLRLGGKEYRVFYGRCYLSQGAQFAGYSPNRSIVLMFPDGKSYSAYTFYEKDIPRGGILVSTPEKSLADEKKTPGDLTLGLRIDPSGDLEVYYPIR